MIKLRDYQKTAVLEIMSFFREKKGKRPLVQAPTGSGKSFMLAGVCEYVLKRWSSKKILIISHVKEILEQDYKALKEILPTMEIGLYSAGLGRKNISPITIAGIHSIYKKIDLFKQFDIIIVDEAHLIPPDSKDKPGMYRTFLDALKKPVIGFTATPFRLGTGYLHLGEGAFFDDLIYSVPYMELQKKGYLCEVSCKGAQNQLDVSEIRKQAGDYIVAELSSAFNRDYVTKGIIEELLLYKDIRKKWLVFAIDIAHAEAVNTWLNNAGIKSACVHSKTTKRDIITNDYKKGLYQCLVSVAVLTTGFDVPEVDMIALLRPTQSPVLHVQIIGRGTRPSPGKKDCLILDFAGNLLRNGPINAPVIKLKGSGEGEPIMKMCDNCYEIVHAAVRVCPVCDTKFQFRHKLSLRSKGDQEVIANESWQEVTDVNYFLYNGKRNINMIKVSYFCGPKRFNGYVCLNHPPATKRIAMHWWKRRSKTGNIPNSSEEGITMTDDLKIPKRIYVRESGKYPEILQYEF